ncbi:MULTISPECIES: PTS sugar transporter subunit IIA [Enterococcus]|nr:MULTISPECIES: PTS sugar transporter subunit IIA [Enterococcus]
MIKPMFLKVGTGIAYMKVNRKKGINLMKKILIATHGHLASGFLSSIQLLTGKVQEITVINAYVDECDYEQELNVFVNQVNEQDQIFVFTDLFGGSVNQKITKTFLEKEIAVTILSGFNLPILLEIVLATKELTKEDIQELVNKCQQEIKMTILDEVHVVNEEEDFF